MRGAGRGRRLSPASQLPLDFQRHRSDYSHTPVARGDLLPISATPPRQLPLAAQSVPVPPSARPLWPTSSGKYLGSNYGWVFTAWGVAGIVGPIIAGYMFKAYLNYTGAFYTIEAFSVISLLCMVLAKRAELVTAEAARQVHPL